MSEAHQLTGFLPKIKSSKHSAAYKIFHYPFLCRIAQMHLVSAEVIAQVGSLTTGNAAEDRNLALQQVDVQLTIAAMAEYLSEGAAITITNPEDAANVYRIIKRHLDDWMEASQANMHLLSAPNEDLHKLDELAGEVYPYARHLLIEKPFHGQLTNRLQELLARRGGIGRLSRATQTEQKQERQQTTAPTHTPMADAIAGNVSRRRKEW